MATDIKTIEAVEQWATVAGTSLYTLCGTRFATPVTAKEFINTQKCLVAFVKKEKRHPKANVVDAVVVFRCLGGSESYDDARDVYHALRARFHNARGNTASQGRIMSCYELTNYQGQPEVDTGFPVHIGEFSIKIGK